MHFKLRAYGDQQKNVTKDKWFSLKDYWGGVFFFLHGSTRKEKVAKKETQRQRFEMNPGRGMPAGCSNATEGYVWNGVNPALSVSREYSLCRIYNSTNLNLMRSTIRRVCLLRGISEITLITAPLSLMHQLAHSVLHGRSRSAQRLSTA